MLGSHFGVLIQLLMADSNSTHSDPQINVLLCASVVDQACESDLRERACPSSCAVLARGLKMNPYLKPSAMRRNAEASDLSGWDRLDRLIPSY